ncbi:right-handed parallel beta-helix repeat-containing protein [Streptomyces pharetrae]|uniref:right-handed parallel beta-helix repeat-containing protein n=1 Tax=Streptomyces pharetrae TaxID=291370 RepID=UPI0034607280
MPVKPAAFMSYVRFNDQHDDGQLSEFRERLAAEVRAQTGEEFAIFQDRNDIAWGQNWQQRIDETLDAVTLLLVIITPSLFRSPPCRDEVSRFLERERKLGRQDLILPVHYIDTREIHDPALRATDELAEVLHSRQHADWRELRFEPFSSPVVRRAIAQLATRMRDTFWRMPAPVAAPPVVAPPVRRPDPRDLATRQTGDTGAAAGTPAKSPSPTHVVDPYHRGHFTTISAAIKAAAPGDWILVRPGLYEESLIVDKPLEIIGDGHREDIEIRAHDASALVFKAGIGRVSNLTLRRVAGTGRSHAVTIFQGRLDLEKCDISSDSLACVAIRDGADPRLRENKIHGGRQSGVFVFNHGLGTLEDNEIFDNQFSGVEIKSGSNPTLRRNQIFDNKVNGVYAYEGGLGKLETNYITGNGGVGVRIDEDSSTVLRHNNINRNRYEGVWIDGGSSGVIEDNDLTGNLGGPWDIAPDCEPNVTRARNLE